MDRGYYRGCKVANVNPIQTSFNAGEWSPELNGRVDMDKYPNACSRMENFYPLIHGPARRRPGTRFVIEVKNSAYRTWLVPFVFSASDALQIEFSPGFIRFHKNHGAVLESAKAITAATQANPVVVTSVAHGYSNGDVVYISDVGGMRQIAGRYFTISGVTANTFTLTGINGTNYSPYTAGGLVARVYTIASPYTDADLTTSAGTFGLKYTQSGDVVYLCHSNYKQQKLIRTADNNWALSDLTTTDGPFETFNPDQTTVIYASARTGAITVTASGGTFTANDVGRILYIEQKSIDDIVMWETGKAYLLNNIVRSDGKNYRALANGTSGNVKPIHDRGSKFDGAAGVQWEFRDSQYGSCVITGYTSSTVVSATVVSNIPDGAVTVTNGTTNWSFGAWHAASISRGDKESWPTNVTFFRERLVFGRAYDQKIWMSVTADYENFANRDVGGILTADSAITIQLSGDLVNPIQWMSTADKLLIGTGDGEHVVTEMTTQQLFGPQNVRTYQDAAEGSSSCNSISVEGDTFYTQAAGRELHQLKFDPNKNGYTSFNKSAFTPNFVPASMTIQQLAYQKKPHSIVWGIRSDGLLMGFSFNSQAGVEGWHRQPIGGSGVVESISSIPTQGRDELWLTVNRTINGQTKRYIEYIEEEHDSSMEQSDAFYVDCGLTYNGSATTALTGLDHLEGETVSVLADGGSHGDRIVSGGGITLSRSTLIAQVGYACPAKLATMKMNAGAQAGTAQTRIKRIRRVFFRLFETFGGKAGPSEEVLDVIPSRQVHDQMDLAPPFFTDDISIVWPSGYERDGIIWYVQEQPFPATILAIIPEMETEG